MLLIRSSVLKEMQGELSSVVGALLQQAFFNEHSHDFSNSGINLTLLDGASLRIFMKLEIIISDEAALHAIYMCKGSSGLKPCFLCQNIFDYKRNARGIVEGDESGVAQYHCCSDASKLVLHTPDTLSAIVRRLVAAATTMSRADFAELQTRLGWNHTFGSLMLNGRLRSLCDPSQHACFDWMHVYFVSGIFNVHAGQLMSALREYGVSYEKLCQYTSEWHWPSRLGVANAADVFGKRRAKASWEAGTLKATASEGLSLLPVMANFLNAIAEQTQSETLKTHVSCFLHLAQIIGCIMRSSRVAVDPAALERSICSYLSAFQALYGPDCMTIKFHFSLHFPAFLRRWRILPNCFVHERKHKQAKRFGNEVRNTSSNWDASVLREVTNHRLSALTGARFATDAGLISPHAVNGKMLALLQQELGLYPADSFATAVCARINEWEHCCKNDVVMLKGDGQAIVGQVAWHASVTIANEVHTLSCLTQWDAISNGTWSSKWRRSPAHFLCMTSEITCSLVWAGSGDVVSTLQPMRV